MNVPEAVHCSGCGRDLGLEPLGQPDELLCPDCGIPFEAFSGGPGLLHDCPKCGGQLVEHALLRELLERREVYGRLAPRQAPRQNPLLQPVRYVPCPACGALMNRKNFGQTSGVIVDVCQKHGIWFDPGELPRVLAFVETGGLERARRRSEELQRKRRQNQVHDAGATLAAANATNSTQITGETDLLEDLADAGTALLGFIGDLLHRD
jgi:Zn-finger nucleic acid-binding protein